MANEEYADLPEGFEIQGKKQAQVFDKLPAGFSLVSDLEGRTDLPANNPDLLMSLTGNLGADNSPNMFGRLYDMLPDLRNDQQKSGASDTDRLKVKSVTSNPDEQVAALLKMGYDAVNDKEKGVMVNGRPLDPKAFLSLQELTSELGENLDIIPGMFAKSPAGIGASLLKGGAIGLGVGTAKELGRMGTVPDASFDPYTPAVEGISTSLAGGLDSIMSGGKQLVNEGVDAATSVAGKAGTAAKNIDLSAVSSKAKKISSKILNDIVGPEAVARESGATDNLLRKFLVEPITVQLENLRKLSPEFVKTVEREPFPVNKRDAAIKLFDDVGSKIQSFYKETAKDVTLNVKDLFKTKSYQNLVARASDTTVSPDILKGINKARGDFLIHIAQSTMSPEQFSKLMTKDIATMTMEQLENRIAKSSLPLDKAWNVRKSVDSLASWGKNIPDQYKETTAAIRSTANAIREGILGSIEKSALPKETIDEAVKNISIFHNLVPVAQMIDESASAFAGKFNLTKYLPSRLSSLPRKVLEMGSRISSNPVTRANIKNFADNVNLDSLQSLASKVTGNIPSTDLRDLSSVPNLAIKAGRNAGIRGSIDELIRPNPVEAQNFTPEDLSRIAPQQPIQLPRDPQIIANRPDLSEALKANLSPDVAMLFDDAIASKDPLKIRTATLLAMEEVPNMFEPSITGNRSEIAVGDHFVLADPKEAQFYKQGLRTKLNMGTISRTFYVRQLSALNDPSDMRIFPPENTASKPTSNPQPTAKISPLESIRNKAVKTVVGDRRSYDY